MTRRVSKAESTLYGYLILVGLVVGVPVYLFDKVNQSVGWQLPAGICALTIAFIWALSVSKKRARIRYLREKYPESDVQKILHKTVWTGETSEQLTDSLGRPAAIDEKLLKTKRRCIWKYNHQGANRYGLRITVENDRVTGWDSKA